MACLLEDALAIPIRSRLVNSLNTNNRWNQIVQGLTTYRIPVFLNVSRLNNMVSRGMTPADWVLEELFDRLCSFEEFCAILRELDLLEELSLLIPAEPLVIEVQPGNGEGIVRVENGEELQLTCKASGVPRPIYQWYFNNAMMSGQTGSVLVVKPFSEKKRGVYSCRVRQEIRGHVSEKLSHEVPCDLVCVRPEISTDLPKLRCLRRGENLELTVEAEAYPSPLYEWFRSAPVIPHDESDEYDDEEEIMPNIVLEETSNTLQVKNIGPDNEGMYCCRVYNEAGETFSSTCKLSVFEHPPNHIASAKVALLIGNEKYYDKELEGLVAPSNDVVTLSNILRRLGFHVLALHNLTYTEMYNAFLWFCRILPAEAYAFFYFAGHGFSKLTSKFMMPIDCTKNNIQLSNCLCDEQLAQILAKGKPLQLLITLFDCCLLEPRALSIGPTEFEHDLGNCNIVVGTATRNHQIAYESERISNSLFVNHLQAHLSDEKPIIEVLMANLKDFQGKQQKPTISFSGEDNYSLTDPVKDDPELDRKLQSESDFISYEEELYFRRTNEHFTVKISKHKGCFLNSIDLEFPPDFIHNFTIEINPKDVELKVENKVVTIHNVQRAKSSMCVTVYINGLRQADEGFESGPHDSVTFSIDSPIITQGRLWHRVQHEA